MSTASAWLGRSRNPAPGSEASGRRSVRGGATSLPRGRAVVGGLLVAMSAVALLVAHDAATQQDQRHWLVARSDIQIGHRVTAEDLGLAPMDLGTLASQHAFDDPGRVIGRVARHTIASGELVQASAIGAPGVGSGPGRRLTLELTPAQALDGVLAPGDPVDVVGTGDDAGSTAVIAADATVLEVGHRDESLGSTDRVRISIVVADEKTATAVIDAAAHGNVSLIAAAVGAER